MERERADYDRLMEKGGYLDRRKRGKLRVFGPDYLTFLHAMVSNDVTGLSVGEGRYGTLLTATGKIVADFHYYRLPEEVWVDVESALEKVLQEKLESFVIMDDVRIEDISADWDHISVQGDEASKLASEILGREVDREPHRVTVSGPKGEYKAISRPGLFSEGFELLGPAGVGAEWIEKLEENGLMKISPRLFEVLRMEAAIPLFGADFSEKRNPLEARLRSAYSLSKGCYPGQEVVAKATHIGGVARQLAWLKLESSQVPPGGASVWSGGSEVGKITSSAYSPRFESAVAMALVKRKASGDGTLVEVALSEEERVAGQVVERFED